MLIWSLITSYQLTIFQIYRNKNLTNEYFKTDILIIFKKERDLLIKFSRILNW